jgi:uncharacterized protein involved in oxidation of intracellular sulfur
VKAADISVFVMADAVLAAKGGQMTPEGSYNVERMLKRVLAAKGRVLLCDTCMDAQGIGETALMEGACRSTLDEPAAATIEANKALVF